MKIVLWVGVFALMALLSIPLLEMYGPTYQTSAGDTYEEYAKEFYAHHPVCYGISLPRRPRIFGSDPIMFVGNPFGEYQLIPGEPGYAVCVGLIETS